MRKSQASTNVNEHENIEIVEIQSSTNNEYTEVPSIQPQFEEVQRPHRRNVIPKRYEDFVVNIPKLTRNEQDSTSESQSFVVHNIKGCEHYSEEYIS